MAKMHYSRRDIHSLMHRMEDRGRSKMLQSQPELCRDLLASAAIIRWMLEQGVPVTAIDVEIMLPIPSSTD